MRYTFQKMNVNEREGRWVILKLRGADIVAETIIDQGITTVFGYPGGQAIDLYDALYKVQDRLSHVLTSHEQHACHAADGYARATGKPGVVIATSGPGATNLVTGIATAHLDSIPLVAITGNVPTSLIGRDSFQEVDITGVTLPITKHNFIVENVRDLEKTLREAFRLAASGRPGPVLVDIPKDVQQAEWDYTPKGPSVAAEQEKASDIDIQQALSLIRTATRPFIYIGGGTQTAGVTREVIELANRIDAPIGCSLMALSVIPTDHPRFLGMTGMHGHFASTRSMAESDLIVCIGARFSDRATGNTGKFAKQTRIVQIDADAAELNKNVQVDLGIACDIKDALQRINDQIGHHEHPAWQKRVSQLRLMEQDQLDRSIPKDEMTPWAVINEVSKYADAHTPIVTDVGQHQMWAAQFFPLHTPRTFISSGGLGTMGFGMGAAIGASLATGRRSILITGDGSFGMNLGELATLHANHIPVTIIVLNNSVLGMVRQWQNLFYSRHFSNTDLDARESDFAAIAQAFGIPGYTIDTLDELAPTLARAMATDGPVLVDIRIDRDEFVLPMLPPGGSFDQIITEKQSS